ncbi:hypothetical protein JX265_009958 [Neoarthrinium moseri]|uniref:Uncharacterized protein n=1 Tax=Neoarthrinium moseri TaxID=1658444 RepID=A0A9P9WFD9_9PEZI|nr:hypothetical protein JX266_012315 [Neoarthrinium moseri]KAI1860559.1 hypothetical protein JX265_009958 [Neoarthrinium moseri]
MIGEFARSIRDAFDYANYDESRAKLPKDQRTQTRAAMIQQDDSFDVMECEQKIKEVEGLAEADSDAECENINETET